LPLTPHPDPLPAGGERERAAFAALPRIRLAEPFEALRIADRGYVIVHGKIAFHGASADELNNNDLIRKLYLGM